ncbi:hypothetical protein BJ742DRAFT_817136 [Cladochytrium replicatum]|nr:hypothetical protein BJ742DRAFT_817136 [Cladochytrium replicatum]
MVIVSEQILYGTLEGFVYLSLDESEQSTSTYPIPDPAIADTVSVQPLYGTLDGTVYLSLNELELDTGARASVTKFYVHFDGSVYLSLHEAEQEDTSKNDIELASVVPTNDRACGPTFYRTRYDFGNLSLDDSGPAVLPIAEGGSDVKTTPDRGAECASTTKVRDLTLYGTPDGVVCLTLEESSPEALPWSEDLAPAADCETLQVYEDEDCPLSDQACEHLPERYTVQSVVLGSYEMNPVGIQYTSTNDIHKETLIFKETGCDQTSRACHISKEIERILTRINGSTNQHVDSSPCIIKIHDEIKTETGGAESSSQCDPIGDDQVNRPEILTHANASTPSYLTTVMSMTAQVHEQTKESAEVALEPTHPAEIAATTFATHNITEGTKEDLTFTKKADAKDKSLVQNSRMPDAFFNKPVEPTTERSEISATPKRSLSASATMAATRNWSIDQETKSKRSYSNTTTNQSLTSPPCEASHQPNSKQPPVKKGLVLERVAFFQPSPTGKEACTEPIRRAGSLESMDAKETEVVQLSQQSSGVHPRSYPAIPKSPRGSLVAEKVSLFQKESAAQPSPGHPKLSIQPKRPIQEETITTTSAQHAVPNGFRKASPYVTTSCTPQSQPQATPRSVSSVKERVRCFEQNATPNPQLPRKTTTTHNGQSRCMHTMLKTFLAVKAN